MRRQDGNSPPPCFTEIGKSRVESPLIGYYRRQEFCRKVRLQIGAGKGEHGIGSRMGLAERIAGKGLHHAPHFQRQFLLVAPFQHATHKLLPPCGYQMFQRRPRDHLTDIV